MSFLLPIDIIKFNMTPLFPSSDEPVVMRQGSVDDCYLLVSLDCIVNSGPEGLELLKSKFTQTSEQVIVRIKRNNQSVYLTSEKMGGQYIYVYDQSAEEDIFILSNKVLKEIDDSPEGVQSNSLAIKILERISSFYYPGEWEYVDSSSCLRAHSLIQRHRESSTLFVGKLLGIHARDYESLDEIVRLKVMNPQECIYLSMSIDALDSADGSSGRHAYRIERIVAKADGNHEFILVNPWDTRKKEKHSLEALKKRDCRFCTFATNQQKFEITPILLKKPMDQGQYIFSHPQLFDLILQMHTMNVLSNSENLSSCINLHRQIPYLISLYRLLTADERVKLVECIVAARGNKEQFIKLLIANVPRIDLLSLFLHNEPSSKIGQTIAGLAIEVSREPRSPVRTLFNSPEFFNAALSTAIYRKAKELDCSVEKAQTLIETQLINFYFDCASAQSITKKAGLQDLFAASVFSKAAIEQWFSPRFLLALITAKYINLEKLSVKMLECLRESNASLVNEEFINIALVRCVNKGPRELFVFLFNLSQLNPALVKAMVPLIAKQFNRRFRQTIELFAEDIVLEIPSEFRTWFLSTYDAKLLNVNPHSIVLKRANRVVQACVEQINNFPVVVTRAATLKTLESVHAALKKQLEHIVVHHAELPNALLNLRCLGPHPSIVDALANKSEEIHREIAITRSKMISKQEALTYLHSIKFQFHLEIISDLVGLFENDKRLRNHAKHSRSCLDGLVKARDNFLHSGLPKITNIIEFQKSCLLVMSNTPPLLSSHQQWKAAIKRISDVLAPSPIQSTVVLGDDRYVLFTAKISPKEKKSSMPMLPPLKAY